MVWSVGINFRATSGYVTDGTGETYYTGGSYPITRGGATFGATGGTPELRDRDSGVDRRIAGTMFERPSATDLDFRIDVPSAGNYEVGILACDAGGTGAGTNCADFEVWDGAAGTGTLLINEGSSSTNVGNSGNCLDAAANLTTQAAFTNQLVSVTLSNTYITIRLVATWYPVLAHAYIGEAAVAGGGSTFHPLASVGGTGTGETIHPLRSTR